MSKARDFKNHVTPAVFSFVVTFRKWPFRKCIVIHSLDKKKCAFDHCNALKWHFWHVASLNFCLRQGTAHERVQFLEDKLFEFDEHIVVIVFIKIIPKSSILSLAKLNSCSCRHKITEYVTFELVSCFYLPKIIRSTKVPCCVMNMSSKVCI